MSNHAPSLRNHEDFAKYSFQHIVNSKTLFEGELMRHVERQKTKLARWLVLKREALLIYKDKINSKSFPERPL